MISFDKVNFIPSTNEVNNSFVGVSINDNKINFHYPESYRINLDDPRELKKDVIAIINSFKIVKHRSTKSRLLYDGKVHNDNVIAFDSMLWVIRDFLKNNIYSKRKTNLSLGLNGKINWRKSFKNTPLIVDDNIYVRDVYSQKKISYETLLVDIHKHILIHSIRALGWLFGVSENIIGTPPKFKFQKKLFNYVINSEIDRLYDDRKILRLKHFLKVINGTKSSDFTSQNLRMGVDSYELVFQNMIDKLFSSVNDKNDFLPTTAWHILKDNQVFKNSKLEPDTVTFSKNDIYIIDSKYYRYWNSKKSKDLPKSSSILKQIAYSNHVKKRYKDYGIKNIFIMPAKIDNTEDQKGVIINYLGHAKTSWSIDYSEENIVHACIVDTKTLIRNWMIKDNSTVIKKLEKIFED